MAKKLISGPTLARLVQIWAPNFFFLGGGVYLGNMLDFVISYHCVFVCNFMEN